MDRLAPEFVGGDQGNSHPIPRSGIPLSYADLPTATLDGGMTIGSARHLFAIMGLASTLLATAAGCRSDPSEPPSTSTIVMLSATEVTEGSTVGAVTTSGLPDPSATTARAPVATTTEVPSTTTTTTVLAWSLPQAQAAQVEESMAVTEALRGRDFHRRPAFETITPEELAERYSDTLGASQREEMRRGIAFLDLFGMATPGADLEAIMTSLEAPVSEPFYDLARAKIVIPTGGQPLDDYQRWVLVGELVRALTHQHNPLTMADLLRTGEDRDRRRHGLPWSRERRSWSNRSTSTLYRPNEEKRWPGRQENGHRRCSMMPRSCLESWPSSLPAPVRSWQSISTGWGAWQPWTRRSTVHPIPPSRYSTRRNTVASSLPLMSIP